LTQQKRCASEKNNYITKGPEKQKQKKKQKDQRKIFETIIDLLVIVDHFDNDKKQFCLICGKKREHLIC
jgi:hypothetical protein